MKKLIAPSKHLASLAVLALLNLSALADQAWIGTTDNQWTTAANWSGGATPGATDNVVYNSGSTANLSNWLASPFSIKGITFTNPVGDISINGSTLTIGSSGIWMNYATANLTINAPLSLTTNQTWTVASGRALTINGDVSGASNLTVAVSGAVTNLINGALSLGTGEFTVSGASTLVLTSPNNAWSGGTLISAGTLQIGNGAGGSVGAGPLTNNSTLNFNVNTPLSVSGVISGTGGLNQNGSGTVTLAATNTYTGATTIAAGADLALGSSGWIATNNANTLTVNGTFDVSALSGGYTLGTNQTLAGNGTILGNVATSAGTKIMGTQTLSNNLTLNQARVFPGGSGTAGIITVAGNLTLASTTNYFDLANVTTEGSGVNDELVVGGNLVLNGTTIFSLHFLNGSLALGTYKLIHYSGSLSGSGSLALDQVYSGFTFDTTSAPGYVLLVVSSPQTATWVGNGVNNNWDVGATADWSSGAFAQGVDVVFDDTGSVSPSVNLTTGVKPMLVTVNGTKNYTFAGVGNLSGPANLVNNDSGTLTLATTNNNYSGYTLVQAGKVTFTNFGTLPASGGVTIQSGATLQLSTVANVTNNLGDLTSPTITGGGTLLKSGAGTLGLGNQGSTAYTVNMRMGAGAQINIQGGALRNGGWQGALWSDLSTWTNLAGMNIATGATNDLWDGNPVYVDYLTGAGVVTVGSGAANRNLYVGVNNAGDAVSRTNHFTGTIKSGASSGQAITLIKVGTGYQIVDILTGSSTAAPTAIVNGGTLEFYGSGASSYSVATVNSGGTLLLNKSVSGALGGYNVCLTVNSNGLVRDMWPGIGQVYSVRDVLINGTWDINAAGTENINQLFGNGVVDTTSGSNTVLSVGNANNAVSTGATFAGTIQNSAGTLTLKKYGNVASQILTGSNTYSGGTVILAGLLQIGNGTTNGVLPGNVNLTNTAGDTTTALQFTVAPNTTSTYGGAITYSGTTGHALVTIAGPGTLLMTGNSAFPSLTVTNGTLSDSGALLATNVTIYPGAKLAMLNGGAIGSPPASLTVNGTLDVSAVTGGYALGSGQTLIGNGTVTGNLGSGASIIPGTLGTAGTLTVNGNLTLNAGTNYFDLANPASEGSGTNDEIVVNGNLLLNGAVIFSPNFLQPASLGAYKLIHYTGTLSGSGTVALDQAYAGMAIDSTSVHGYILLVVSRQNSPKTQIWVGNGINNSWDIGVTPDWTTGGSADSFQPGDSVIFDDTGSASPAVNLATSMKPASVTVNGSQSYTFAGSGLLGGSASLNNNSSGTLTIATVNNTYTGPTVVQAGQILFQDFGTLPASGGISLQNGGAVQFNLSAAGVGSLGSASLPSVTGSGTLIKGGTGTLALGNQAGYKINVALGAGSLIDLQAGTLQNGTQQGGVWTDGLTWTNLADMNIDWGATNDLWDGNPVYVDALTGSGIVTANYGTGTRNFYVGANNAGNTNDPANAPHFYGYIQSGTAAINVVKIGTGYQILDLVTGSGTIESSVTVNGGTLELNGFKNNSYLVATVNSGGTLFLNKTAPGGSLGGYSPQLTINSNGVCRDINPAGNQIYNVRDIIVNGTFDLDGCAGEGINGLNGNGVVDTTGGNTSLTLGGGNNANGTFAGTIQNTVGALTLTMTGPGSTQILTGSNSFSGGTTIMAGTLQIGNAGTNGVLPGNVDFSSATNATAILKFVVATNTSVTWGGAITYTGTNGFGQLYKDGLGTLVLLGNCNFPGNLTVNGGTLAGNARFFSGLASVNSGATLAPGSNSVIGTLVINNNLTFAPGSTAAMTVNSDSGLCSQIAGLSNVTFSGTLAIQNLGVNPPAVGSAFQLFSAMSYSGSFATITPATPGTGLLWDTSALATSGILKVAAGQAPPAQFSSVGRLANGNVQMTFSGTSGFGYRVWATTNVALRPVTSTWTLLSSGTFGASPVTLTDTQEATYPARFYLITIP